MSIDYASAYCDVDGITHAVGRGYGRLLLPYSRCAREMHTSERYIYEYMVQDIVINCVFCLTNVRRSP